MKSFEDELVHKTVAELFDMVKSRQSEVDELKKRIDEVIEYVGSDFNDYYTGVMVESIHEILKGNQS